MYAEEGPRCVAGPLLCLASGASSATQAKGTRISMCSRTVPTLGEA